MQIGALGDIVFEVSAETVKTITGFQWNGSAQIATQARHMGDTYTEFTGVDADTISFNILLSSFLSNNPMDDIDKIWEYERTGKPLSFVLGTKVYGKYKWLIKNHKVNNADFDGSGNMITAQVSINLIEHTRK